MLLIDDAPETKHGWLLDQKESNFSTSRGRSHCVKSQAFVTIGGNSGIESPYSEYLCGTRSPATLMGAGDLGTIQMIIRDPRDQGSSTTDSSRIGTQ